MPPVVAGVALLSAFGRRGIVGRGARGMVRRPDHVHDDRRHPGGDVRVLPARPARARVGPAVARRPARRRGGHVRRLPLVRAPAGDPSADGPAGRRRRRPRVGARPRGVRRDDHVRREPGGPDPDASARRLRGAPDRSRGRLRAVDAPHRDRDRRDPRACVDGSCDEPRRRRRRPTGRIRGAGGLRCRGGRNARPARAQRLGQVHARERDRRPGPGRRGPHRSRRPPARRPGERRPGPARRTRGGDGLPGPAAVPAPVVAGERCLPPPGPRRGPGRRAPPRIGTARTPRPRRSDGGSAARALGRAGPTRGARPSPRSPSPPCSCSTSRSRPSTRVRAR